MPTFRAGQHRRQRPTRMAAQQNHHSQRTPTLTIPIQLTSYHPPQTRPSTTMDRSRGQRRKTDHQLSSFAAAFGHQGCQGHRRRTG
ncbi:hypothetical protein PGT21_003479 [Puccinia graminis f. sp. tritici]|uniref:Uncharacterized protein n=1 Tax=Puccinia graminis f. sp. tritici TaxID=56615 RepID=A0A5B0PQL6_PUCGR|nr:hypothetical protein PGT21_003479 [Puccinia graminis f. sp. tritici]